MYKKDSFNVEKDRFCDLIINLKELLKNLTLVINLKRLINVIKEWDTTWISCDSLHAWL